MQSSTLSQIGGVYIIKVWISEGLLYAVELVQNNVSVHDECP